METGAFLDTNVVKELDLDIRTLRSSISVGCEYRDLCVILVIVQLSELSCWYIANIKESVLC